MKADEGRNSQRAKILGLLVAAHGEWVELPKITACAAQYGARILELRRLGFRILNRTQKVNGSRHSWFRLETAPPQSQPAVAPINRQGSSESLPLFPEVR
jgi:hypothetical protein